MAKRTTSSGFTSRSAQNLIVPSIVISSPPGSKKTKTKRQNEQVLSVENLQNPMRRGVLVKRSDLYIFRITVGSCYSTEPMNSPLFDGLDLKKRVDCCNRHQWRYLIVCAFPETFSHLLSYNDCGV